MKKITDYKISILHASFGRPELGTSTAKKWLERAKNPDRIEYIMCLSDKDTVDNQHWYLELVDQHNSSKGKSAIQVFNCPEASLVAQTNLAVKYATGNLYINVCDDSDCPEHWDTLLLQGIHEAKEKKGIDSFFTVKVRDGIQPFLQTMPIIDKEWYDKFGYFFYPEYTHQYIDSDLSMTSHRLGRTLYVDLLFQHLHYSIGAMKKDSTNEKNDATADSGSIIFGKRGGRNFDLKKEEIVNWEPVDIYKADFFNK